ncbi:MAG: alanine/glycine:cation symporter family protein [Halieaceae bacterium]|nr:alanine/glycine:cation symporter family protein [Halieaceae bacterium]
MLATVTDWLWSYVLIVALLAVGLRFSIGSRFVQLRLFTAMFRGLTHSHLSGTQRGISSFQALVVSVAGRVGGGNIAGVAVAITLGGPGALFWMWLIALLGMATSLFESAFAQLYKQRHAGDDFRGGPAYFMRHGLGWVKLPVIYSLLLLVTIGFGFNAVQTYAVTNSIESAFGVPTHYSGIVLTAVMAVVLFGGIRRLALFAEVVVPVMVVGYFLLALTVLVLNFSEVPAALALIFKAAFGLEQVVGGGVAAAIMQGARRGLFSNEAGLGTVPNVAAAADVPHPMSQGLVQSLSVFIDTIVLCTCTALMILVSSAYQPDATDMQGVTLTQLAVAEHLGPIGEPLVSIALVMFAVTTIAYNSYLGENSIAYFERLPKSAITVFRCSVLGMIAWASVQDLGTVFSFADLTMALLALTNLAAMWKLYPLGLRLLSDFEAQRKQGQTPVFVMSQMPEEDLDPESWGEPADLEQTG